MCAFVVSGFSFSIPSQELGLGNVSEMTYSVSSGMQNLNSINQLRCTVNYRSAKMDDVETLVVRSSGGSRASYADRQTDRQTDRPGRRSVKECWSVGMAVPSTAL